MRVAVSRCLLGDACRYDGAAKPHALVQALCARPDIEVLGICPECAGGLPTPRVPAERLGSRVVCADGADVTGEFELGARRELDRTLGFCVQLAILKERSPSCGVHEIYDGSHSGTAVAGRGVFAEMLAAEGVPVRSEEDVEQMPELADLLKYERTTRRI